MSLQITEDLSVNERRRGPPENEYSMLLRGGRLLQQFVKRNRRGASRSPHPIQTQPEILNLN
jgi:hypothetical protein